MRTVMKSELELARRVGARTPAAVTNEILLALHMGTVQTVNLMEQIAMDMPLHFRVSFQAHVR
jgi:hypothetical protein